MKNVKKSLTAIIKSNAFLLVSSILTIAIVYYFAGETIAAVLGAALAAAGYGNANKQKAEEAKITANEHENLAAEKKVEVKKAVKEAKEIREETNNAAKKIKPMPDKPKKGTKRKRFRVNP